MPSILNLLIFFLSALIAGCAPGPAPHGAKGKRQREPQLSQVQKIEHWSNSSSTRVVITTTGEVRYRDHRLKGPDRLYLDLSGARLSPTLRVRPIPVQDGLLKQIRVAQNRKDVVRVVLDLDAIRSYQAFVLYEPFRLVIDIQGEDRGRDREGAKQSRSRDPKGARDGEPPARKIHKVVLDPGHGGKDPGARNAQGLVEKEIALDIALRLKRLLQAEGSWQVVLTREEDIYLSLEERTAIANRERADLFISLHVNASLRPQLKGLETYFLNPNSSVQAIELAARENQVSPERMGSLQLILRDLRLSSKLDESSHLAHSIQTSLVGHLRKDYPDVADLGVRQAPFYVLMGASMPSVLVETSFLTNPQEWERLQSQAYREAIARALLEGIVRYRTSPLGP